ncbi:MAG: DUF3127 domain-containing protein [Bacteroidales bacterium]|nr:DUF3127 domain-containing protein [Bacteroidales bacterium]
MVQILPLESGMGRNGEWKKQNIIVETDGQYPKKICISIWGDKINPDQLQIGNLLTVDFDVESREFNGRWYTDVKAWKVESAGGNPLGKESESPLNYNFPDTPPAPPVPPTSDYNDLPF